MLQWILKFTFFHFRGAYRFSDVMASARPETVKIIQELQTRIQPDEGCAIQFSSVRIHGNLVMVA
jgi:hypothetical protein